MRRGKRAERARLSMTAAEYDAFRADARRWAETLDDPPTRCYSAYFRYLVLMERRRRGWPAVQGTTEV